MVSTFGWLDTDAEQRRKMLEVVDLFKEQGTLDELGIGSIRDAIADSLFPGTSVLHTRLRYVMFIPWLMERAATKATATEMTAEFRRLEYRLIGSLLSGGEHQGVIGNTARDNLRRLPSSVYWSALGAWGIRTTEHSPGGFFRRQHDYRQLAQRSLPADDPGSRELMPDTGLDSLMPHAPTGLLSQVTFDLTPDEESYLSDRIATTAKGSMLAWLVHHPPGNTARFVWDIDNLSDAPARLQEVIDHGRRFHTAIHGAALLYNLLLARKTQSEEAIVRFEDALGQWSAELTQTRALEGWDRASWWAAIRRQNPRLSPLTVAFFDGWIDLIEAGADPITDRAAEVLITNRERQIKGGRARLFNQSALDQWSGASGLSRHEFRWGVAQSHLQDLYAGRADS